MRYALAYRLGLTPWERYGQAAGASIAALLDREEAERPRPLGRALDVGCGRGQYSPELARREWEAVGIDNVTRAIDAAKRKAVPGVTYVVGDVTDLAPAGLGAFDFFFDVGCFFRSGWGVEGRRRRGLPGLGDPVGGARRHHRTRVATDQDSAPVVPAAPVGLAARRQPPARCVPLRRE
jgi:SAM-dependent methyltransferase